jgi:hypothetical protein
LDDYTFGFSENGLAKVELNGKWGFVNAKGEVAVPIKYDYLSYFRDNGLARGRIDGKTGSINEKGEVVIPFK